jgi:Flp pilus assembly protein TadG
MKGSSLYKTRKGTVTSQRAAWRTFCNNSDGAALLEFAFLTPILMLLITGIIQFGSLFFLENNMATVARDTARRLAVGDLVTKAEAKTHVQDALGRYQQRLCCADLCADGRCLYR